MRVIAGQYKGRDLLPPVGQKTRPITGSVKKSLFGMLGEDLTGAVVVDLYCGTGTLGIEALSRGAARCYFGERDPSALGRLRRNIEMVGAQERCVIWAGDVEQRLEGWLGQVPGDIDLAFVDPPYAQVSQWDFDVAGRRIFAPLAGRLAADGMVVLRASGQVSLPQCIGPLVLRRVRRYGDMTLALLAKTGEDAPASDPQGPADDAAVH